MRYFILSEVFDLKDKYSIRHVKQSGLSNFNEKDLISVIGVQMCLWLCMTLFCPNIWLSITVNVSLWLARMNTENSEYSVYFEIQIEDEDDSFWVL